MCKLLIAACVVLWAGSASAQIDFRLPSSGGPVGSGDCDPSQWSDPTGGGAFGGSVGACTYSPDGGIWAQHVEGTSDPATCAPGSIFNLRTDTGLLNYCKTANVWVGLVDKSMTSTSGFGFVVDEDDMASNSATKLPTQQSVKAYVDAAVAGAGSTFDPGSVFEIYDDFATGNTSAGGVGSTGAGVGAIASGTFTQVSATGLTTIGLVRLNSHATNDNSGEVVYLGNANTTASFPAAVWTAGDWSFDAVVVIGSNSTAITNTALFVGLAAGYTSDLSGSSNAIMIRRDTDLSETGAFKFVVCNASGAAGCNSASSAANAQVVASTISPSAGSAYRFRIRRAASGVGGNVTIYFRVNGEAEKTFCSSDCDGTLGTYTATSLGVMVQYLTRTTTGVMSSDVDYMYMRMPGLSRY